MWPAPPRLSSPAASQPGTSSGAEPWGAAISPVLPSDTSACVQPPSGRSAPVSFQSSLRTRLTLQSPLFCSSLLVLMAQSSGCCSDDGVTLTVIMNGDKYWRREVCFPVMQQPLTLALTPTAIMA